MFFEKSDREFRRILESPESLNKRLLQLRENRFYFLTISWITGGIAIYGGLGGLVSIFKGHADSVTLYCPIFILLALQFHIIAQQAETKLQTLLMFKKLQALQDKNLC